MMSAAAGRRILVLEDDVILALDATEALEEIGVMVIGPAHRVSTAMALLDAERPDAAMLDVNIVGGTSADVAARLLRENIPYILVTGYGEQSGIEGSSAIIDKPYDRKQLQAAVIKILSDSTPRTSTERLDRAE